MRKKYLPLLLGAVVFAIMGSEARAGHITDFQDSVDFDWKYEWDVDGQTPTLVDLDTDGADWVRTSGGSSSSSVSGGILTFNVQGSAIRFYDNVEWDAAISAANGYTVEMRVRVVSNTESAGAISFQSGTDGNDELRLNIGEGGQGANGGDLSLGADDNSTDFNVFRVAQVGGSTNYTVWRNGVELLDDAAAPVSAGTADRLLMGIVGTNYGGVTEVDYIRFTSGAFSPIPEPSAFLLAAIGLVGLIATRRRK